MDKKCVESNANVIIDNMFDYDTEELFVAMGFGENAACMLNRYIDMDIGDDTPDIVRIQKELVYELCNQYGCMINAIKDNFNMAIALAFSDIEIHFSNGPVVHRSVEHMINTIIDNFKTIFNSKIVDSINKPHTGIVLRRYEDLIQYNNESDNLPANMEISKNIKTRPRSIKRLHML